MTDDVRVSTEIPVDDETRAALLLFNERLEAAAADERATKRVAKAERAKDEAAAKVRKLESDSRASAEEKAEANEAYKLAVSDFNDLKADPHAPEREAAAKAKADAEARAEAKAAKEAEAQAETDAGADAASEPDAETAEADDATAEPTEVSADELTEAPAAAAAESE